MAKTEAGLGSTADCCSVDDVLTLSVSVEICVVVGSGAGALSDVGWIALRMLLGIAGLFIEDAPALLDMPVSSVGLNANMRNIVILNPVNSSGARGKSRRPRMAI